MVFMRSGHAPRLLLVLSLFTPTCQDTKVSEPVKPRKVEVRFVKSPFADYLFYLLYRNTGHFAELEQAVPLGDIPILDELISLPEVAASTEIHSYPELQSLVLPYRDAQERVAAMREGGITHYRILVYSEKLPSYEKLSRILVLGEAAYPKFALFWEAKIAPEEDKQIAAWREQLTTEQPFDQLQRLARLRFPSPSVDVAAIALQKSGSANTYPEGIYTSLLAKPNLSWTVGHEGTHLLVDEFGGLNWISRPQADQAIKLAEARGGDASDIEEALCLLMQVKLSQASGETPSEFRLSTKLKDPSVTRDILVALENAWRDYQSDSKQDLIDFVLAQTIRTMNGVAPHQP
jgi:hypothetical protein